MNKTSKELVFYDDFNDDRAAGAVIGTFSSSGQKRKGVDSEKVLSIDNGALRIAPLIEAGFGRAVLSYGPFSRRAGLAFAVWILNGHNTSQSEPLEGTFYRRIRRWLAGSETDPQWKRIGQFLLSRRIQRTLRQFRWWKRTADKSRPVPLLEENLAVGLFSADVVSDPRMEGNGFIMHALAFENGELWIGGNGTRSRSLRGVQNLPLFLIAVLRPGGIVYYVSSLVGAPGMGSYPYFQPVAIEHTSLPEELYFGIQQSVLGQMGWRQDTRIQGVLAGNIGGYECWFGGAHAADRLTGDGVSDGTQAEVGGTWRVFSGKTQCVGGGDSGSTDSKMAILNPVVPSGLIQAMASPGNGIQTKVGLIWRFVSEHNHWRMEISQRKIEVILVVEGERKVVASNEIPDSLRDQSYRLNVLDDGRHMMAYLNGDPVKESWIAHSEFEGKTGVGFLIVDGQNMRDPEVISCFEAHPRQVSMPGILDMGSPPLRRGNRIVVSDDFNGAPGDMAGRLTPVGNKQWRRVIGSGVVETTGSGSARIKGSVHGPCPGRTAYCIDWDMPDFADLEVVITPPGTQKGENERSKAGFILYQDKDNYVTLNVWRSDYYGCASVSTFFKFNGFEDIYDAVWTNIGDRVYYGRPSALRLCCDGDRYLAYVNDEPVLYRAFRDVFPEVDRLRIRRVGLLANWEFGNDTGSRFEKFRARY